MSGDTPAVRDELEMLREKVRKLTEFARAHEEWEAHCLIDGGQWVDEMIDFDEFHEVQRLRGVALAD